MKTKLNKKVLKNLNVKNFNIDKLTAKVAGGSLDLPSPTDTGCGSFVLCKKK